MDTFNLVFLWVGFCEKIMEDAIKWLFSVFFKPKIFAPLQTPFPGHLQLIKFWPSCALGRGSAAGRKFLAPPYCASAQCLRLSERFFHCHLVILTCSDGDRLDLLYRTAAAAVQLLHLVFLKPHVFPEIIPGWAVSLEGLLKRTFENCWCVIFIGWMPFLSPN